MNKYIAALFMAGMFMGAPLFAQDDNLKQLFEQIDSGSATAPGSTPKPALTGSATAEQEPTIITASKEATFDASTKTAVLYGDVQVKNPQFTLSADKLTVIFHKDAATPKKSPTPKPQPAAAASLLNPKPGVTDPAAEAGGIEQVIAEGNVVITSDRPDPKGGPPVHYVGKGQKVIYTPATGEAILSGWPELAQGASNLIATDDSTVIYLYREGKMHAEGHTKTVVLPPPPDQTPAPDKTPIPYQIPEVK